MNITNTVKTALKALSRNKMRSGLTTFGIVIGGSSVIVMVGLGNSTQVVVRQKIFSYGANALSVLVKKCIMTSKDMKDLKRDYYKVKRITIPLK